MVVGGGCWLLVLCFVVVGCWLVVGFLLFVDCRLLFVVVGGVFVVVVVVVVGVVVVVVVGCGCGCSSCCCCCCFFVVCCLLYVFCCLLFLVVGCLLLVVCCFFVVCCLLYVVCCLLFLVVGCLLFVVCCCGCLLLLLLWLLLLWLWLLVLLSLLLLWLLFLLLLLSSVLLLLLLLALLFCFGKEPCNAVVLGSRQVAPFSKCWVAWPRMPKVDTRWATVTMQPIPVGEVPWFGCRVRGEVREVRVNLCVDMICFLLHTVDGRNPAPPWGDLGCIHLANIFFSIILNTCAYTCPRTGIHPNIQTYTCIMYTLTDLLHTYRQT